MLKDRGNKKWTAMMLTEHVRDIREWYESDNDITEPQYDEFSLNALADDLNIAYQANSNISINYWKNKRSEEFHGQILELLPNDQAIKISTDDFPFKLYLKYIIKVDIYE
ncbi:YolD-like family protein [Lysinibacillus sp. SGAir0095]|uniref:YolD-like family protein n=1 Tax=Lysinibacillus sp. SGAir0095 TaxID=2070463 RepID=UPI0010CD2665|nr:YolD-like family protein [Lysinibacillus sp. SGAir0095]QCR33102.1 hypothetical protein C1N55_13340 [Lysinibacillus sp. SGAir0095]